MAARQPGLSFAELQNLTGYDFTQAAPDLESEQARLEAAAQPRVLKCLHEFIAAGGLSDSLTAEDPVVSVCKAAEPH